MPQPKRAAQPAGVEVTVRTTGAWVCPVTDHTNHKRQTDCGRCGAPLADGRVECREAP